MIISPKLKGKGEGVDMMVRFHERMTFEVG